MQRIAGDYLYHASAILGKLRCVWSQLGTSGDSAFSSDPAVLTDKQRADGNNHLGYVRAIFNEAELSTSVKAVDEFRGLLHPIPPALKNSPAFSRITVKDAVARLDEIERTVRREMQTVLFMLMLPSQAQRYENPTEGWESAITRWPKITTDVEEASRCFACDRYGAAVFHALLVAEFGVIQIADFFSVKGDRPGWGCVERLDAIHDRPHKERTTFEREHSKLLDDSVRLIHAVKDWRHKIAHVDNWLIWQDTDFSPHRAEELILATRGLMRHLASDLPIAP